MMGEPFITCFECDMNKYNPVMFAAAEGCSINLQICLLFECTLAVGGLLCFSASPAM